MSRVPSGFHNPSECLLLSAPVPTRPSVPPAAPAGCFPEPLSCIPHSTALGPLGTSHTVQIAWFTRRHFAPGPQPCSSQLPMQSLGTQPHSLQPEAPAPQPFPSPANAQLTAWAIEPQSPAPLDVGPWLPCGRLMLRMPQTEHLAFLSDLLLLPFFSLFLSDCCPWLSYAPLDNLARKQGIVPDFPRSFVLPHSQVHWSPSPGPSPLT